MAAILCLAFICAYYDYVPLQCVLNADHEQGEPVDGNDFTDTGVGCIDDCLEPASK